MDYFIVPKIFLVLSHHISSTWLSFCEWLMTAEKKEDACCIIFALIYIVLEIPDAFSFSHQPFLASKDMVSSCSHKSVNNYKSGLVPEYQHPWLSRIFSNKNMASLSSPFSNWLLWLVIEWSDFLQNYFVFLASCLQVLKTSQTDQWLITCFWVSVFHSMSVP